MDTLNTHKISRKICAGLFSVLAFSNINFCSGSSTISMPVTGNPNKHSKPTNGNLVATFPYVSSRQLPYSSQEFFGLYKMVKEYHLRNENLENWNQTITNNKTAIEELGVNLQQHNARGLKDYFKDTQNAFSSEIEHITCNDEGAFWELLVISNKKGKDLSEKDLALIKRIQNGINKHSRSIILQE
jgi:hypothetical protein